MIRRTETDAPSKTVIFTAGKIPNEAAQLVEDTLIVIPSKVEKGSYREKALTRVLSHLEWSGFPLEQVEVVSPSGNDFCKGRLITEGAKKQNRPYLLQIDGDVLPDLGGFYQWLLDTGHQDRPCQIHRGLYRMDKEETSWVCYSISKLRCRIDTDSPKMLSALCAGGFWIPRDLYLKNPVDDKFVGWGSEDVEFGRRIADIQPWEAFDKYSLHHWHEFDRKMKLSNLKKSPHTTPHTRSECDRISRQKIVILGAGRCGSVLLERTLDLHPDIEAILDEPLSGKSYHDPPLGKPASQLVTWILRQAKSDSNVVLFKLLNHQPSRKFLRGPLLEELRKQGFIFLHLIRENTFEQVVSHFLAQTEQKYVTLPYESESVEMDIEWAEKSLDTMLGGEAATRAFLKTVPENQKLEFSYEDLRDNFEATIRDIQESIGVLPRDLSPATIRQSSRPADEVITNANQIKAAIAKKTCLSSPPPHFYKSVAGWFDYEWFFDMAIEEAKNGETIVEIGAFKGMSTCYAGVEIQRRNPTLRFDVIDHFKGSEEHQGFGPGKFGKEFEKDPEYLYKEWLKNTEPVSRFVRAVKMDSKKAHEIYREESLAAVFIDGDHSYNGCKNDILNWLPKVRIGGFIGGHDFHWKGVQRAVTEIFPRDKLTLEINAWCYRVDGSEQV